MSMLSVNDVQTGYGSIKILNGVTIEVDDAEVVGIIGPNGAGKSTTFKAIFGLLDLWEGSVEFQGTTLDEMGPDQILREGMCFVMQGHRIFPKMTVTENLEMGGYTVDDATTKEQIDQVFEMFPTLRDHKDAKAKVLSGGQQKMLEIGMALMVDPDLLLLDEPSLGLAPSIQNQIFDTILRLRDEYGLSSLVIEQNVRALLENVDRAYVLEQGEVSMTGSGEELLNSERVIDLYLGSTMEL